MTTMPLTIPSLRRRKRVHITPTDHADMPAPKFVPFFAGSLGGCAIATKPIIATKVKESSLFIMQIL